MRFAPLIKVEMPVRAHIRDHLFRVRVRLPLTRPWLERHPARPREIPLRLNLTTERIIGTSHIGIRTVINRERIVRIRDTSRAGLIDLDVTVGNGRETVGRRVRGSVLLHLWRDTHRATDPACRRFDQPDRSRRAAATGGATADSPRTSFVAEVPGAGSAFYGWMD